MVFKKPNWGSAPKGYIAGLGRGATGFTTRADITQIKQPDNELNMPPGLGRGRGRGLPLKP